MYVRHRCDSSLDLKEGEGGGGDIFLNVNKP